ncbi:MAG: tetratricopeptide repeat protein, partial [Micromonosporaceae bacterium]
LGDQLTNASIEQRLAVVEIRRGRHSTARELSEGSLSVAEDLGDQDTVGLSLRTLGDLALAIGRPGDAAAYLERALGVWQRLGRPLEQARILARLERAMTAAGDPDSAGGYRSRWRTRLAELGLDEPALRLPPFHGVH